MKELTFSEEKLYSNDSERKWVFSTCMFGEWFVTIRQQNHFSKLKVRETLHIFGPKRLNVTDILCEIVAVYDEFGLSLATSAANKLKMN